MFTCIVFRFPNKTADDPEYYWNLINLHSDWSHSVGCGQSLIQLNGSNSTFHRIYVCYLGLPELPPMAKDSSSDVRGTDLIEKKSCRTLQLFAISELDGLFSYVGNKTCFKCGNCEIFKKIPICKTFFQCLARNDVLVQEDTCLNQTYLDCVKNNGLCEYCKLFKHLAFYYLHKCSNFINFVSDESGTMRKIRKTADNSIGKKFRICCKLIMFIVII